jgi:hypothetical protein
VILFNNQDNKSKEGRTVEVGLAFGEEGLPMVEGSWIQPCLEPERTIEVGAPFGEESPPTVEDSCV